MRDYFLMARADGGAAGFGLRFVRIASGVGGWLHFVCLKIMLVSFLDRGLLMFSLLSLCRYVAVECGV